QVLDRDTVRLSTWLAAGVQGVLLRQVLRQRAVRIGPRPEVVQLAPDLLRPASRRVREEREGRIRLARGLGVRGVLSALARGLDRRAALKSAIALQGAVGIIPRAEITHLALDLL